MFAALSRPTLSFTCAPEDLGVIAPPTPAKSALPEWFRRLAPVDKAERAPTNNALTDRKSVV